MNTKILLLILLVFSLVLTSCGRQNDPFTTNYYVGTKGIEIDFLTGSPPKSVREGTDFPLTVMASNEGAFSLNGTNVGVLSYSYDAYYFTPSNLGGPLGPQGVQLLGRSVYVPSGENNMYIMPSFRANSIVGQRENPSSSIDVTICYPYQTTLVDQFCIDFSSITYDARQKVCDSQSKSYDSQGAPIVITEVTPEMQSFANMLIRPAFLIKVEDRGSGRVLSPPAEGNPGEVCLEPDRENFNKVRINAMISNDALTCEPAEIKLHGGVGETRCFLNEGGYASSLNYLATLIVKLEYVYSNLISREVSIVRSLMPIDSIDSENNCEEDWLIEIGGKCVNKCEVKNQLFEHINVTELGNVRWGCNCNITQCNQMNYLDEDNHSFGGIQYYRGTCIMESPDELCPALETARIEKNYCCTNQ